MGKFVKNDGTKIPIGTVLFDGATQSDFTLTDDISNYENYRLEKLFEKRYDSSMLI